MNIVHIILVLLAMACLAIEAFSIFDPPKGKLKWGWTGVLILAGVLFIDIVVKQ